MNRLQKIKLLLNKPFEVINSGILAQSEKDYKTQLNKKYNLKQLPTIDILDFFQDFEEELTTYSFLEGTSLITDLILLKKLARRFDKCNYLEIGSWRGESIANISENAVHCTTINLSAEEMKGLNLSNEFIEVHGAFSKNIKNLTEIFHNSHTYDFENLKDKFDLIFIDGDHSYEGILNDTRKTFNLRKDTSSIIVWHDYGFTPESVRHTTLKAILDGIPVEYHKNLYHISNTLCSIYIENCNYVTSLTRFPSNPNKRFSIKVKAYKL
jgi:predicted O-methyltransferase YrrM